MVRDAFRFVVPLLVIATVSAFCHWLWLFYPSMILAAFVCYFFRNPRREIPSGEKLIVSPADGKVVKVDVWRGDGEDDSGQVISIFLNVFDVHVNRAPVQGEVETVEYRRGRFKAAYDDEASRVNEQNVIRIHSESGRIVVKQIAGLIARRVVCWKQPGSSVERGELIGLIRFGSRVDVLFPGQVRVWVRVGERVKGGSSIIGEFP